MEKGNTLKKYLRIWCDCYLAEEVEEDHLSSETLYQMAEAGGMAGAGNYEKDHLSLCPRCLEEWAAWRRAIRSVEEAEGEDEEKFPIISCGMLRASKTGGHREPITLESDCGKFTLGIFPQVDDPGKGMITLEVSKEEAVSVEDRHVEVKDIKGHVLVSGKIRQGRVARRCMNLYEIELRNWTVFIE